MRSRADSDDAEIAELSRTLNSFFGEQAKDANLFRNPNGPYMKLANTRCIRLRASEAFQEVVIVRWRLGGIFNAA
jgi:hypothetical protein